MVEYGEIKEMQEQPKFPVRTLLRVPHQDLAEGLVVTRNAFGPNTFRANVAEMAQNFCYPNTREVVSFEEPTTSESISAAAFDFVNLAKPEIFNPNWFQAGYIVKTSEGVYANPPKDIDGNPIFDEERLKMLRDKAKKVNGIWILENGKVKGARDFGFAPSESFKREFQDCETFAEGGLARILEHTQEKTASKLRAIASPENYKEVNVCYFDATNKPALRVVVLSSNGDPLRVSGYNWDDIYVGCAFGVLRQEGEK